MSARRLWTLVGVLLAPAVLLPLWVSYYNREDPTLLGFPFFYWFQFLLIVVSVALTWPAFLLSQRAERLDRVRHGLPAEPGGPRDQERR
ncbi:DUF3311 domain-containing protein [Nocardioides sp.]|uniref:DUF3311 domain-containing protein n=1 Tax=Nocardioides sp. TaxID=35761 RepID=UPI003783F0A3